MVLKFKLVSETETWQSIGKGLSEHKSFWHLAVEIPKLWLGLPTLSTNLILIQSQKRILRPTGSSTWGEFWERSPCISLTFTLWLMTIPIKGQAGFRVWAASSACRTLSGSMDTFFLLQDLSFRTFLNPCIRGHEELFSTWLQPVWCVRVSLLHSETRGHILTQSNSFIACKKHYFWFPLQFLSFYLWVPRVTPAEWVAGANGFPSVLWVCRQDHGVPKLPAGQGGCWEEQGELPEDADPSWPGALFCLALWNVSPKCPLQNLLERKHARTFLLNRKDKSERKKKKKERKIKTLYDSVLPLRKNVLTPLPPPPCMVLSHSDLPNSCRSIPLRKHPSELWCWIVPLLHYLVLCWQPSNFSLPLPTSWLLLVE